MEKILWSSIERLAPLQPKFVSVTYGAGGSTRERTHNTVARMVRETSLKPAAHLTCVNATREEIDAVVQSYWDAGVRHIVALRGDPAEGVGYTYRPHPGGYAQTSDLVAGIKRIGDFKVSVSAYPEKHPEAASLDADIDALKAKVDAGADQAITQFFFDNEIYLRYLDKVRAAGIEIPIIRASCRCRTSSRRPTSPAAPAPPCPTGSPPASRGWRTTSRPAASWPPRSPPSRFSTSSTRAWRISTSTR